MVAQLHLVLHLQTTRSSCYWPPTRSSRGRPLPLFSSVRRTPAADGDDLKARLAGSRARFAGARANRPPALRAGWMEQRPALARLNRSAASAPCN